MDTTKKAPLALSEEQTTSRTGDRHCLHEAEEAVIPAGDCAMLFSMKPISHGATQPHFALMSFEGLPLSPFFSATL